MRIRRGLLYAAFHGTVAVGLLYWQEAPYWDFIPTVPGVPRAVPHEMATKGLQEDDSELNEDRAPMNLCELANNTDRPTSSQERILAIDNLPVALATGWHLPCGVPSRLDRAVQSRYGFTQKAEVVTGRWIAALALLQWFLVGAYPLMRRKFRRWYSEPALFMTLCTAVAMSLLGLALIVSRIPAESTLFDIAMQVAAVITQLAALPMIFVAAAWAWWLGLAVYTRWKAFNRRRLRAAADL